jgi:hypothetical protein
VKYQLSAPNVVRDLWRRRFPIPVRLVLRIVGADEYMELSIRSLRFQAFIRAFGQLENPRLRSGNFPASIQKVERSCEQRNESSLGDRPNRRRAAVDTRKNSYRSCRRSRLPFSIAHLFGKQSRRWGVLNSQAQNNLAPIVRHFRACHEGQKRSVETSLREKYAVRHSFGLLNDPQFTSDNRVRYFSGEFRDWVTGKFDARMKDSSAADFQVIRKTFNAESRVTGELFQRRSANARRYRRGEPFLFSRIQLAR